MNSSVFRPNLNGMPGKPPLTRITIARGAKDYDPRRIPELAAEKARLEAVVDKTPIAPIRLKKLENRSAPKEIRSSYPGSPVARVERHIEETQRRLHLWDKDPDQRDRDILDLKERVALLERLNAKMEEEKDEKQARLMSLQLLMSQREAEKRELEHIVSRLEIHNSRVEEEVSTKQVKLKALLNEINQREREKMELREEVSALKRQKVEATESRQQKEQQLRELEAMIASRELESQELRNKVASLENLTESIEKEKEDQQKKLMALEETVLKREQEKKDMEERVTLLETRNWQIEETKIENEERVNKLEAQHDRKDEQTETSARDTVDAGPRAVDRETEEKLKKLQELEKATMRHEAEREELQQLAKYLQQRNVEMDLEKEEKRRQLTELQLAVVKKDAENYELKQKLVHLEAVEEKAQMDMDQRGRTMDQLESAVGECMRGSDDLQKKGTSMELEADNNTVVREPSMSADVHTDKNLLDTCDRDITDGSSEASLSRRHSAGYGDQDVNQPGAPTTGSNKPVRPHSPRLPPQSMAVHTSMPYIAGSETFSYKLQQKYLMKEQEVQERHIYLPEEKDLTPQNHDAPDAPYQQDQESPDAPPLPESDPPNAPSVYEYDTPDAPAESDLPDVPAESDLPDAPTELGFTDAPTELGLTDAPTELGLTDAPTELGLTDTPAELGLTDAPTELGLTDAPAELGLPEPRLTHPESFQTLVRGGEPAAQHEKNGEPETYPQDRRPSTCLSAPQQGGQDVNTFSDGDEGRKDTEDDEETEEEVILTVTEEEITRTRQQLEQIEIEMVKKKAESAYLRKSVEDLLSMMESADDDYDDEDGDHEDDLLDDLDSEASSSDESDEYFVEMNPMDPAYLFGQNSPHLRGVPTPHDDITDGAKTPSTARASPCPEDIGDVKRKLEELERDIEEKTSESERIKNTMDDLRLQKMVAAEEKKLTKQKLDDLQRSEAQLKQLLAILQLRRATESEENGNNAHRHDDDDDGDDDNNDVDRKGKMFVGEVGHLSPEEERPGESISEEDRKALRDAIIY